MKNSNKIYKTSKRKCLISNNESESSRIKISQYEQMLEKKERSNTELMMQVKELQYQVERLRRAGDMNLYSSPMYDFKQGSSLYESPFRNFLPSNTYKYSFDRMDISGKPLDIDNIPDKSNVEVAKSVKINLSETDTGYKSKAKAEKYSSNAVSAALAWSGPEDVKETTGGKGANSGYEMSNAPGSYSISLSGDNTEIKQKADELEFNLKEEKRLAILLKDPPVQYRKPHKLRELREDLKKIQRNIYELQFYLKSNADS